jgi:hypothetical protein
VASEGWLAAGTGEGKRERLVCEESMEQGSTDYDYCQGLLLVGIFRMRWAEVEWMEEVGGNFVV